MVGNKLVREYILITSSNFPNGGASANYLNLFCKGLMLQKNKVKVLLLKGFSFGNFTATHKRNNITDYNVPFTYLGFVSRPKNGFYKILNECLSSLNLISKLFSILPKRKKTTLLIYSNELHSNIIIYFFSKLFRIEIVTFVPEYYGKYVFEGSLFRKLKWYGFLFNFSFLNKLSRKLIVFSHYLKDQYLKQGFKESDIIIQPNLTDFEYWEMKGSENLYTIGYSGSPSIKDGLQDLFKAISLLKETGMNVSLLVIGDTPFGNSLIPDLKIECQKLCIEDNVHFSGLVELSEVKKLLSECKILTLTRRSTVQTLAGFPTKLGEYFASKKKVLVTNFGDIERYFTKDKDLVIAETGNVEEVSQKIKWILENDTDAEVIAAAGYQRAKLLLEYKSSIKRIADIIS
jgi:glycosyltransferase involved in cell wall biosynthesis